jgi:hypothetical protein
MSALPPEADMLIVGNNVCYVPLADIGSTLKQTQKEPRRREKRKGAPGLTW